MIRWEIDASRIMWANNVILIVNLLVDDSAVDVSLGVPARWKENELK